MTHPHTTGRIESTRDNIGRHTLVHGSRGHPVGYSRLRSVVFWWHSFVTFVCSADCRYMNCWFPKLFTWFRTFSYLCRPRERYLVAGVYCMADGQRPPSFHWDPRFFVRCFKMPFIICDIGNESRFHASLILADMISLIILPKNCNLRYSLFQHLLADRLAHSVSF